MFTGLRRSVYYALVNSQLIYGISLWGSAGSPSNLSALFAAQKKTLRAILRIPRLSRYCPGHTKQIFITLTLSRIGGVRVDPPCL